MLLRRVRIAGAHLPRHWRQHQRKALRCPRAICSSRPGTRGHSPRKLLRPHCMHSGLCVDPGYQAAAAWPHCCRGLDSALLVLLPPRLPALHQLDSPQQLWPALMAVQDRPDPPRMKMRLWGCWAAGRPCPRPRNEHRARWIPSKLRCWLEQWHLSRAALRRLHQLAEGRGLRQTASAGRSAEA